MTTNLNFYQLYLEGFSDLHFGGTIVDESTADHADFRLHVRGKEFLAAGEECEIISEASDYVVVRKSDSTDQYTFTKQEFEIAEG